MKRFVTIALCLSLFLFALIQMRHAVSSRAELTAAEPKIAAKATWSDQIKPIVQNRCAACHSESDSSAPFSLSTFDEIRKRADQIVEVTNSGYMPPWLPSSSDFPFAHNRRMPDDEVALLARWVEAGMPQGTPTETPEPNSQPKVDWKLGEPDLVLSLDRPYELSASGNEVFWNFVFPLDVTGMKYVDAVEIQPGNPRAVHHIVGMVDRTASARRRDAVGGAGKGFEGMEFGTAEIPAAPSMLWSPGKAPAAAREGIGWAIDSQTDIVLQMHMFPSGKAETVSPRVGLHFAERPPTQHPVSIMLEAATIDIPAGGSAEVGDQFELPVNVKLISLYPHAHYLGKRVVCTASFPDGPQKTLLNIENWDFNWQDEYEFEVPVELPKGTVLSMTWSYDNTADNVRNPNTPPTRVVLGNRSTDEMGSLLLQVICANAADQAALDESRWLQKVKAMPRHTTANQNLGNLYESRGELQKALSHYRVVVDVTPRDSLAHDNLASTLAAIGDDKRAEHHFRRAISLNPENALAHNNWGAALMRANRIPEAIEKIERALELWPQFPEARVNLGEAELRRGDSKKAAEHFRMAAKQSPTYALAHFNLGTVLMSEQRFSDAEKSFRRATNADEDFAAAFNNLGICLFQQSKLNEAAQQFRRSIQLDPADENPQRNLRVVEQQMIEDHKERDGTPKE